MFNLSVDSIVKDFEKKGVKPQAIATELRARAQLQHNIAKSAMELASEHEREAERADRINERVKALLA